MLGKHYSKISIGTANLESEYGLLKKNKLSFNQFKKIINFCKKNKIKFIDTSNLYKDSEKLIGKIKQSKLKIITKSIFNLKSKSFNIRNSCINLRKKPYAILIHKFIDYKKKRNFFIRELKKNRIKNFGVSIYTVKEFKIALRDNKIKIIQIPGNFFNQKLLNEKLLQKAQKKGIQIEVRSVFMQGLLFEDFTKITKILKIKNKEKIRNLKIILKKYNLRLAILSLLIIIKNPFIKRVILGINYERQLLDILSELKKFNNLKIKEMQRFYFNYNKNFNILNWKKKN